jgi:cytochrome c-type biogenesis protein CcmH/NrfG
VNQGKRPTPEPDPKRLSLESLEEQLRALPPSKVPDALHSKLIAAIPPAKAAAATATGLARFWPWIAGVSLICVAVGVALYSRQTFWNPKPHADSNENLDAAASSKLAKEPPATSKAVQQLENAVRLDPYNADAWFSLAKAQADVQRTEDAISSAQKAIDIARSRNRSDLAGTIEGWLRSHRNPKSGRPNR